MRNLLRFAVCIAAVASSGRGGHLQAQAVSWDNVHINVTEPAQAAEWYVKNLGAAQVGIPGQGTQVKFGNVLVVFLKGQEQQRSAGSLIDHIDISYEDLDTHLKQAENAGAKVLTQPHDVPGLFKVAFIEDPFGIKIEMVQDAGLTGFHHVHLSVAMPETTLRWYQDMFGGERAKLKGRIDGLRYGGVWLLAQDNGGKTSNPDGAVQYIGLLVPDIHKKAAELQAKSVKFSVEPRQLRSLWYAIAQDCDGSRVEMIQRSEP
jgi:predicted enzyme related to lactoylglutathione lyase